MSLMPVTRSALAQPQTGQIEQEVPHSLWDGLSTRDPYAFMEFFLEMLVRAHGKHAGEPIRIFRIPVEVPQQADPEQVVAISQLVGAVPKTEIFNRSWYVFLCDARCGNRTRPKEITHLRSYSPQAIPT